jgi:hypothetical protein
MFTWPVLVTGCVWDINYQVYRGIPDSVSVFLMEAANAILFGTVVLRVFVACLVTGCLRAIKYQVYRGTPDPVSVFLMEGATAILFGTAFRRVFVAKFIEALLILSVCS